MRWQDHVGEAIDVDDSNLIHVATVVPIGTQSCPGLHAGSTTVGPRALIVINFYVIWRCGAVGHDAAAISG